MLLMRLIVYIDKCVCASQFTCLQYMTNFGALTIAITPNEQAGSWVANCAQPFACPAVRTDLKGEMQNPHEWCAGGRHPAGGGLFHHGAALRLHHTRTCHTHLHQVAVLGGEDCDDTNRDTISKTAVVIQPGEGAQVAFCALSGLAHMNDALFIAEPGELHSLRGGDLAAGNRQQRVRCTGGFCHLQVASATPIKLALFSAADQTLTLNLGFAE